MYETASLTTLGHLKHSILCRYSLVIQCRGQPAEPEEEDERGRTFLQPGWYFLFPSMSAHLQVIFGSVQWRAYEARPNSPLGVGQTSFDCLAEACFALVGLLLRLPRLTSRLNCLLCSLTAESRVRSHPLFVLFPSFPAIALINPVQTTRAPACRGDRSLESQSMCSSQKEREASQSKSEERTALSFELLRLVRSDLQSS